MPPVWFPEARQPDLWVLESLDERPLVPRRDRGPSVRSSSAIVADLDNGRVLWAKDADSQRSVASLTKLVSSLTLVATGAELDREVCITLEQWPTRPGARSKFETGDCATGWELVGAALIASDNRGAFSMPALADEEYYTFIDRMAGVAEDLTMHDASFVDPAGLEDENLASARDLLKAVTAVSLHPQLATMASAPYWLIDTARGDRVLGSTNRILALSEQPARTIRRGRSTVTWTPPAFDTLAGKTGYTDTAHYCFATVVQSRTTGRRYAATVLNAPTSSSRFDDVLSMLNWADREVN
jgi:serine-type D-Ala-D-Ala endopeptidase (penicillin-binding protein 7)